MTNTDNYTLDTDFATRDLSQSNPSGFRSADATRFKPKPFKDGQTYTNKLFVSLVRPRSIPGFENYPSDHKLFYVKLFGHYVPNVDNPKRVDYILCKVQHNKYAASLSKESAVKFFEDNRCPSCEEAQVIWDQYTVRWSELGYPDKESRKTLSKEEYKRIASDPQLSALKDAAMVHQFKTVYAIPVYNLEQQPLQTGLQWFFAPEMIFKGMMELVTVGVRFYSLNPHPTMAGAIEGSEVFVIKDATNGLRRCEYSVKDNRAPLSMTPEEVDYLRNEANLPPLLDLVTIWDYDTHKEMVVSGIISNEGDVTPETLGRTAAIQSQTNRSYAPQTHRSSPTPQTHRSPVSSIPVSEQDKHSTAAYQEVPPPAVAPVRTMAPTTPTTGSAPRPRRTW